MPAHSIGSSGEQRVNESLRSIPNVRRMTGATRLAGICRNQPRTLGPPLSELRALVRESLEHKAAKGCSWSSIDVASIAPRTFGA